MFAAVCCLLVLAVGVSGRATHNGQSTVAPADLGADASVGTSSSHIQNKIKGLKASLYLFAPDQWITTFNAIPVSSQECLISVLSNRSNAQELEGASIDTVKSRVDAQCPNDASLQDAFFTAIQTTVSALPASFVNAIKQFGTAAKQMAANFHNGAAAASGAVAAGNPAANGNFKQGIAAVCGLMANFTQSLSALSDSDRQQVANQFPKLAPFLVGSDATALLNELTATYQSFGTGQLNITQLQAEGTQLKATLQNIWAAYEKENANGIQEASQLLGKDLKTEWSNGAHFGFGGMGGMSGMSGMSGMGGMGGFSGMSAGAQSSGSVGTANVNSQVGVQSDVLVPNGPFPAGNAPNVDNGPNNPFANLPQKSASNSAEVGVHDQPAEGQFAIGQKADGH